jgi:hypothetical protein
VPRAGPLRYWTLTLIGLGLGLGSLVAFGWGLYNLVQTGTCASGGPYVSANPCPDDTVWHIMAVTLAPFAGSLAIIPLALRGGRNRLWTLTFGRREKRLADKIARGEAPMPAIARPPAAEPVPSLTPLNRTWPPATWEPAPPPTAQTPPAGQTSESPVERLNRLAAMKDKGLISVAEFEAQKKQILGGV